MEREEALAILRDTAVEILEVEPATFVEATSFKEDLEVDSLDIVDFVVALEERLSVRIPEDQLKGIETVGDAVDLVVATSTAVRA